MLRAIRVISRLCGIRYVVDGATRLDAATTYVLVPNHSSPLDIPAVLMARPSARFVAAAELFRVPLLGGTMRALGSVAVVAVTVEMMVSGPLGQLTGDPARSLGIEGAYSSLWSVVRWPIGLALVVLFLVCLYRFSANVRHGWRDCLPGAASDVDRDAHTFARCELRSDFDFAGTVGAILVRLDSES
mgnify:CR=1 FL=1